MAWPGRPSTSPVCAKRSTVRNWRPRVPASKPSHFATEPECPVDGQRAAILRLAGAAVVDREGERRRRRDRQAERDGAPRRAVGECRRPGRVERRRRRRGGRGVAVAAAFGTSALRTGALIARTLRPRAFGPRRPAFAAARAATRCRRRFTGDPVDQVARPWIRDDDARGDDDGQRDRRPHADRVVPVEVARLPGEAAAEPDDLLDRSPGPRARDPEVGARQDDEQEGEVGGTGDRAAGRPVVAGGSQPAVPVGDAAEEGADAGIAAAEQPARVGIGVGDDALADGQRDRRRGIPPDRHCARLTDQPARPDAGEQRVDRQRRRGRRRRQADVAGIGVVDELLLERQQDAGGRHDEHDDPGGQAGGEVEPEEDGADALGHGVGAA